MTAAGTMDLRPLKAEARRLLPPGNGFRVALLAEPDHLPHARAIEKLETYLRLALALRGAAT
jgi:hypothetical protein